MIACNANNFENTQDVHISLEHYKYDSLITGGVFRGLHKISIDTIVKINQQEYVGDVCYVNLQELADSLKSKEENKVLVFITSIDRKFYMAFKYNSNSDFNNNKLYECDKDRNIVISNYPYYEDSRFTKTNYFISPTKSTLRITSNSDDRFSQYGILVKPFYKYGVFENKGDTYNLLLTNMLSTEYKKENTFIFFLKNENIKSSLSLWDQPLYRLGDTVFVKDGILVIDSLSLSNKLLTIHNKKSKGKNEGLEVGEFLPQHSTTEICTGKKINIGFTNSKYTLIDFWGTWCAPCIELTPRLKKIYSESSKDKVHIIGVVQDTPKEQVIQYITSHHIEWDNVLDPIEKPIICSKYKINSFPAYILLDSEGKIIYRGNGEKALREIEFIIKN